MSLPIFRSATGETGGSARSFAGSAQQVGSRSKLACPRSLPCSAMMQLRTPSAARSLTAYWRSGSLPRTTKFRQVFWIVCVFRLGGPRAPMIKSELVQKVAEANPHLYQRDVENIVEAI